MRVRQKGMHSLDFSIFDIFDTNKWAAFVYNGAYTKERTFNYQKSAYQKNIKLIALKLI